jgi:Tfp pilus assembly protein PilF
MKYRKNIFTALLFVLAFSYSAFSQSIAEKIGQAVKGGEQIWNATSPDKSFMSEGNTMEYGLGYLKAGNYTSASWSFDELLTKNKNNAFANFFMGCVRMGLNDNAGAQKFLT